MGRIRHIDPGRCSGDLGGQNRRNRGEEKKSECEWPMAVAQALPAQPIATTFVQPDNYRSFQIKGLITDGGRQTARLLPGAGTMCKRSSR